MNTGHDHTLRARLAPQLPDLLFAQSLDSIYVLTLDGTFIDANDVLLRRLSMTRETLLTMDFQSRTALGELDRIQAHFDRAVAGETVRFLATGFDSHGEPFRSEILNTPMRLDGEIVAVLGIARDIGPAEEQVRSRKELEQRFERVLNTISDGIFFVNKDWMITYANPSAEAIALRTASELEGRSLWEVTPPTIAAEVDEPLRRAMIDQRTITMSTFTSTTNRWFETTVYPSPDGLAIHVRDVSESMATVARAKIAEKRIADQAALLDIARDAIVVRKLDQTVSYWNPAAEVLYGWSAAEAIGRSIRELTYLDDTAAYDLALAQVMREGYWAGEIEQYTRRGQKLNVECRWNLVYDDDGNPESVLAVNTDITERKRDAERNIRVQRMESLGALAGGIAHDLNNILTPMLMSVQLLAEDENDTVNLEILRLLESGVMRGADMVRQVVSFARGVESKKVRVDVTRLVSELCDFARNTLPNAISITSTVEPNLRPILGDPTQLMQVLANLVTNARDAMPVGGSFTIHARGGESLSTVIEVTDSGQGMSAEVLGHIFDPFFTTKLAGFGTGLGLATAATIIDNHDASITVASSPSRGTTFTLVFPAAEYDEPDDTPMGSQHSSGLPPPGNGECVLVVDDEPAIRETVKRTLESNGYRVITAENGLEALTLITDDGAGIDVVFTDITMPVVGGMETAETIHAHHPHLPVVAASGYPTRDDVGLAQAAGIRQFLPKPYTTSQLCWAMHKALQPQPEDT